MTESQAPPVCGERRLRPQLISSPCDVKRLPAPARHPQVEKESQPTSFLQCLWRTICGVCLPPVATPLGPSASPQTRHGPAMLGQPEHSVLHHLVHSHALPLVCAEPSCQSGKQLTSSEAKGCASLPAAGSRTSGCAPGAAAAGPALQLLSERAVHHIIVLLAGLNQPRQRSLWAV